MKLAFYRGTSWISRIIRWMTRGIYSHVAVQFDGETRWFEAWHIGGVRWIEHLGNGHSDGTRVDIFEVLNVPSPEAAKIAAEKLIGKPYDFWGVLGFVTRRRWHKLREWFCSESASYLLRCAGITLVRGVPDDQISPSHLASSVLLRPYGRAVTGKTGTTIHLLSTAAAKERNELVSDRPPEPNSRGDSPAELKSRCHGARVILSRKGNWTCAMCQKTCAIVLPEFGLDVSKAETVVDLRKANE